MGEHETKRISTLLYATIERLTPAGSVYRESALTIREKYAVNPAATLAHFVGIAEALKSDYEDGYMHALQELLHAEMFADFLEMADHLLSEGYKDPAAVLTGSVLEEHLRTLAVKTGQPIDDVTGRPLKAGRLNADLGHASVYSKLGQKSITAWLDLRNKAAHGVYGEYAADQVAILIQSVRDFISRHPA